MVIHDYTTQTRYANYYKGFLVILGIIYLTTSNANYAKLTYIALISCVIYTVHSIRYSQ